MNTITISRNQVKKDNGVVILPLKEYQKLLEQTVPTYYLHGKEAKELDTLVAEGLKEYHDGKTISAKSLDEALKIHEKKNKRG